MLVSLEDLVIFWISRDFDTSRYDSGSICFELVLDPDFDAGVG